MARETRLNTETQRHFFVRRHQSAGKTTSCLAVIILCKLKKTKSTQPIYTHTHKHTHLSGRALLLNQGDYLLVQDIHRTTQNICLVSYFSSSYHPNTRYSKKILLIQIKIISKTSKSTGFKKQYQNRGKEYKKCNMNKMKNTHKRVLPESKLKL